MTDPFDPFSFEEEGGKDVFATYTSKSVRKETNARNTQKMTAFQAPSSPHSPPEIRPKSARGHKSSSKNRGQSGAKLYNLQNQKEPPRKNVKIGEGEGADAVIPKAKELWNPLQNARPTPLGDRKESPNSMNGSDVHANMNQQTKFSFKGKNKIDSDIFSQLFKDSSKEDMSEVTNENAIPSSPRIGENEIQIQLQQSEQMTCIYDSEPSNTPLMEIKGAINIKPTTNLLGKTFYIAIQDTEHHLKEITSFFEIAKEVTDLINVKPEDKHPFVTKHQHLGNRIYKITIPPNADCLSNESFQILKYEGSEFLRPIPLLVSTKVRVAGKVCRVGVKIRSNPSNKEQIKNMVSLIAIPPDVNGESMKMSRKGGVWDPIKRVIIYKCDDMNSGETVHMQLQFEYLAAKESLDLPRFPVLVRCDGVNDQLSQVELSVGGTLDDVRKYYGLKVEKNYKLFHRKI